MSYAAETELEIERIHRLAEHLAAANRRMAEQTRKMHGQDGTAFALGLGAGVYVLWCLDTIWGVI